jgi:hypothetical protein
VSGRAVSLFGNLGPALGVGRDSCLENVWAVAVVVSHLVIRE